MLAGVPQTLRQLTTTTTTTTATTVHASCAREAFNFSWLSDVATANYILQKGIASKMPPYHLEAFWRRSG